MKKLIRFDPFGLSRSFFDDDFLRAFPAINVVADLAVDDPAAAKFFHIFNLRRLGKTQEAISAIHAMIRRALVLLLLCCALPVSGSAAPLELLSAAGVPALECTRAGGQRALR